MSLAHQVLLKDIPHVLAFNENFCFSNETRLILNKITNQTDASTKHVIEQLLTLVVPMKRQFDGIEMSESKNNITLMFLLLNNNIHLHKEFFL